MDDRFTLVIVVVVTPDLARVERARLGVKAVPVRACAIEEIFVVPVSAREVTVLEAAPLGIEVLAAGIRPAEVMSRRASGRDESALAVEGEEALMEDGERADATLEFLGAVAVEGRAEILAAGVDPDRMLLQGETSVERGTLALLPPALPALLAATPVPWGSLPRDGVTGWILADEPGVTARLEACSGLAPEDERGV